MAHEEGGWGGSTQIQFSSIIGLNISIDAILNYISQAFQLTHLCTVQCRNTNEEKDGKKIAKKSLYGLREEKESNERTNERKSNTNETVQTATITTTKTPRIIAATTKMIK